MNVSERELRVKPINNGTVIDHIESGQALNVLKILGIGSHSKTVVSLLMNVPSGAMGAKDVVKVEGRELDPEEVDTIALISPRATINIIRNYEVAEKYRAAAENGDLEAVGRIFCEDSPCGGELFEPGVEEVGKDYIVLRMTACPLLEAWREHGLSEDDIDTLCSIASAVDEGTFEGAGLDIEITERLGQPGADRCLLRIALRS